MSRTKLTVELTKLRKRIADEEGVIEEAVCSDEFLESIAVKLPMDSIQITNVPGYESGFNKKYTDWFIECIQENCAEVTLSNRYSDILRDLSYKLTDLSKRNPMLKMNTAGRFTIDISDQNIGYDFFGTEKTATLFAKDGQAQKKRAKVNSILREIKSMQRDRGQNDLYVAYPFACGKLPDFGDETVRVPLALFPVSVSIRGNRTSMSFDNTRDIVYNSNLVLLYANYNDSIGNMESPIADDFSPKDFIDTLIKYYGRHGITIVMNEGNTNIPLDSPFPDMQEGTLVIQNSMVLGKFSNDCNAIQKDYFELIRSEELPPMIKKLITTDVNDFYYETASYRPLSYINEHRYNYINPLDGSQETIINELSKREGIVIQGPPGCGKSQVITGIVANALSEEKSVLIVSEKKTALDVISSRLGPLSRYALLIDDSNDKDAFYGQIRRFASMKKPENKDFDISPISNRIESSFDKLTLLQKIYSPAKPLNIEPNRIYSQGRLFDHSNQQDNEKYRRALQCMDKRLFNTDFESLHTTYLYMRDGKRTREAFNRFRILEENSWIGDLRPGMTDMDLSDLFNDIVSLKEAHKAYASQSKLARMNPFNSAKKNIEEKLSAFNIKYLTHDLLDPGVISDMTLEILIEDYHTVATGSSWYIGLDPLRQAYVESLYRISDGDPERISASNDLMMSVILDKFINEFDSENLSLRSTMKSFEDIRKDISEDMQSKMDLVTESLGYNLRKTMVQALNTCRNELNAVLDTKNKFGISKFFSKLGRPLLRGVRIWMMTPEAVSDVLPLEPKLFDYVIFDEASQLYVERSLPAIYRGNNIIISGDHKQLRPSSLGSSHVYYENDPDDLDCDDVEAALEQESLLDLARINYESYFLNYHYRSKYQELIQFSNYAFYNGKLNIAPNTELLEEPPITYTKVENGCWRNNCNIPEAERVVELLRSIIENRKDNETIGIITFNSAQRDLIYDKISSACSIDQEFERIIEQEFSRKDNGEDCGLFIKNIETVQGDERDIIVFSTGYGHDMHGDFEQRFGWLNQAGGENRLNVAITRARKKIHIVTSIDPEDLDTDKCKNPGPGYLMRYLQYCKAVSDNDCTRIENILLSLKEVDTVKNPESDKILSIISESLREHGYEVTSGFEAGEKMIDLAVRSKDSGHYLMGLQLDSNVYSGQTNTRDRDYHMINYLNSRGWNIMRIWTPEFWRNWESEENNILRTLKTFECSL